MKRSFFLLLVGVIGLSACSHHRSLQNFSKRKYMGPFQETKYTSQNNIPHAEDQKSGKEERSIEKNSGKEALTQQELRKELFRTIKKTKKTISKDTRKQLVKKLLNEEKCDEIVKRNGEVIKAKVTEVGISEVKYHKCENLTGPVYVVKKSDVYQINYANGTQDFFEEEYFGGDEKITQVNPEPDNINTYPEQREVSPLAVSSLIGGISSLLSLVLMFIIPGLGVLFLLSFGIGAIVTGIQAIKQIKQYPERYEGKGIATGGIVIGSISLFLFLMLILIAILILASL